MDAASLPEYTLITLPEDLAGLAETLHREPMIAVDTESNSLFAYQEQVCLVQFSTREADFLVDPLALADFNAPRSLGRLQAVAQGDVLDDDLALDAGGQLAGEWAEDANAPADDAAGQPAGEAVSWPSAWATLHAADLSALKPVFEDPAVEKVFHASEYDLLCLKRDFGIECANLFDTMQAARILGSNELGLGSLLEVHFGVVLDKRHQRADWGERPLTPAQLDYARHDTHYLLALRDVLYAQLDERGLVPLAQEDFRHLTAVKPENNGRSPRAVDPWRVTGAYDLHPQQVAILRELCEYRDRMAQRLNRPLFKVIQDRTLVAIAERMPDSRGELSRITGMTPHQVRRHGRGLLEAVKRGMTSKPIYPPKTPRPDERYLARLDGLKNWRKKLGQQVGVASDVILPRDLMSELALAAPKTLDELHQVMQEFPWRYEHFGGDILKAMRHG